MTQECIAQLLQGILQISGDYVYLQKRDNIEKIKELVPQIQKFVLWFMDGNQFGVEQQLYEDMCHDLLEILQDILTALENNDKVLMHDAVAYGLSKYLECMTETEMEDK